MILDDSMQDLDDTTDTNLQDQKLKSSLNSSQKSSLMVKNTFYVPIEAVLTTLYGGCSDSKVSTSSVLAHF